MDFFLSFFLVTRQVQHVRKKMKTKIAVKELQYVRWRPKGNYKERRECEIGEKISEVSDLADCFLIKEANKCSPKILTQVDDKCSYT